MQNEGFQRLQALVDATVAKWGQIDHLVCNAASNPYYGPQGGISDEGDAENYSLSLAGGGEFMDGRGSAVFSVDYSRQKSIKASDRSFAGTGLFGLGFANQAIFDQLGLTDGDFGLPAGQRPSQAFYPNVTLPVSSRFGIIAIDNGFASAFDAVNLINPDGSVPRLPGTNIPVAQVFDGNTLRAFNGGGNLEQYPGSPAIANLLLRPQDRLRLFELHPTDHRILEAFLGKLLIGLARRVVVSCHRDPLPRW